MTGRELIKCIKKYDLEDEEIIGLNDSEMLSMFFTSRHANITTNELIVSSENDGKLVEYVTDETVITDEKPAKLIKHTAKSRWWNEPPLAAIELV